MDSRAIEMRLRRPAPEEPVILPPLVLPAFDGALGRVTPSVRFRRGQAGTRDPRFAFALALLALAAAAVVIAGALRLLNDRTTPVNQLEWPPAEGVLGIQDAFTMAWPDDWRTLAEGGLYQGDFTQVGISYERVALVVANTALGSCPSPGTSGGPLVVPSGVPGFGRETADPALACLRNAVLPAGAVRVIAEVGERSLGVVAAGGPAIPDQSEPTDEGGWTELVDGQPARLTVISGPGAEAVGAAESRIWDVIFPATIDHVLRIRADLAGPDLAAGRAAVQGIIDSIDFKTEVPRIDESKAGAVLVQAIDQLDQSARESRSDFYACFPREPGVVEATISAGPGEQLVEPVAVTCATAISASRTGVWRITLTARWKAGAGYAAGGLVQELFPGTDGVFTSGGYLRPLDAEGHVTADAAIQLPGPPRMPPDPVDGPLLLGDGSFVELLWPGIYPADSPGAVGSEQYPMVVGWHAYIVGGAQLIDGVEWYPVQWDEGVYSTTRWLPASRDGLPTIAPVEPSCPTGAVELETLMRLTAAERLVCLGNDEVTLGPVIATPPPAGVPQCLGPGLEPTSCPVGGVASWLEADPSMLLYGEGGQFGPLPGLPIWADPSTTGALPLDQWLRVRGHFDDSVARDCRNRSDGVAVDGADALRDLVLVCRERFVITGFEPEAAP